MTDIRRILCPVDFSETSRHAIDHAVAAAAWYGSAITALHVIPVPVFPTPPILTVEAATWGPPTAADRQARLDELRVWMEPAFRASIRTDLRVDQGNAVDRVLEAIPALDVDLVVMGTHGLSGLDRFMLGSVAESVLRKARCPVMTVPPAAEAIAKVPYKRVLCPVDFSNSSLAALRFAFAMAKEADAAITVLHVFDWPPENEILYQQFDTREFHGALEKDARERLDALITEDVREWCRPCPAFAFGKPYREILATADRIQADLIVIGIRGRNAVDLTMFGSTTNKVVRRANCPVLTLRG